MSGVPVSLRHRRQPAQPVRSNTAVVLALTRANLAPNPAAGADIAAWITNRTLSRVSVSGFSRPQAGQITGSGSGDDYIIPARAVAAAGNEYVVSAEMSVSASSTVEMYLVWLDAAEGLISFVAGGPETLAAGTVIRRYVSGVAPANTATVGLQVTIKNSTAVMATTAHLTEIGAGQNPYGDGESAGWAWDGAQYNSTSRQLLVETVDDAVAAGRRISPPRRAITVAHRARITTVSVSPPYFPLADWLWRPIPTNPLLDPRSAAIVARLAAGSHIANYDEFGVTLRGPHVIAGSTPRYDVAFRHAPGGDLEEWGPDPIGADTMPIPGATPIPPGSDGQIAVADHGSNKVYSLWQAVDGGASWGASWGARVDLNGDGRENAYGNGASTGARLSRFACVIRAAEITRGEINHALFFSCDSVTPGNPSQTWTYRYPAAGTDGSNDSGSAITIDEGARVQLDPSINLAAIPGITPAELAIGRALQTYGAYCGDNGGARMAFILEYLNGANTPYISNGLEWDFFDMTHIPWVNLRVLAAWDGGILPAGPAPKTARIASPYGGFF